MKPKLATNSKKKLPFLRKPFFLVHYIFFQVRIETLSHVSKQALNCSLKRSLQTEPSSKHSRCENKTKSTKLLSSGNDFFFVTEEAASRVFGQTSSASILWLRKSQGLRFEDVLHMLYNNRERKKKQKKKDIRRGVQPKLLRR